MGREAFFKDKEVVITHREQISLAALVIEIGVAVLAALILLPSIVLLSTKDALPDDNLYPYKLKLEGAMLSTFSSTPLNLPLRLLIVGRRFEEGTSLFRKSHSSSVFGNFIDQMNRTAHLIIDNPQSREQKRNDSVKFINRLRGYKDILSTLITRQEDNVELNGVTGEIDKVIELLDSKGVK